jgi:hypothetical protein
MLSTLHLKHCLTAYLVLSPSTFVLYRPDSEPQLVAAGFDLACVFCHLDHPSFVSIPNLVANLSNSLFKGSMASVGELKDGEVATAWCYCCGSRRSEPALSTVARLQQSRIHWTARAF